MENQMDKIVSLCKRRGFIFQSSEIYGGLNGFWDYGPLGVELKRNVKETWWKDMITRHDELNVLEGAPESFSMVGLDCSIVMHPQVWKCSGHYDLFHDFMVDCKECKSRMRVDHVTVAVMINTADKQPVACESFIQDAETGTGLSKTQAKRLKKSVDKYKKEQGGEIDCEEVTMTLDAYLKLFNEATAAPAALCPKCRGELTAPREFNLMFKTTVGALAGEEGTAFLRPETAQGMFVNFKNVVDSSRVKVPFGIAQIGKSFRNEITPRNFIFRSREFEQMEMEFFCHPDESRKWYDYWRDRRYEWYVRYGLASDRLQLRDHTPDELGHYSVGTADVEYAFPFLEGGEFGELEGVAHRGDFDLRSHMEGKLVKDENDCFVVQQNEHGQPKYRGSGKDLRYFNDQSRERFIPHVIEPAAGADRATLAFLCEAYQEDEQPDEKGNMKTRVYLKFHPQLAPIKVAVFPLIKKDGMPEKAGEIYHALKSAGIPCTFDQQAAIGRRYRRQDEIGTPWCLTVDGQSTEDNTVTLRDRDTLEQIRLPIADVVSEITARLNA